MLECWNPRPTPNAPTPYRGVNIDGPYIRFGQLGRYAYFNTFKVPFQKSVRLTYQCPPVLCPPGSAARHLLFIQARGVSGLGAGTFVFCEGLLCVRACLVRVGGGFFWGFSHNADC